VAALLGRAIEHLLAPGYAIARVSVVFVRPVPITTLVLAAELRRDGRAVKQAVAAITAEDGTVLAQADGLAIRVADLPVPGDVRAPQPVPPRAPESSTAFTPPFFAEPVGYHTAMELRIAGGVFGSGAIQVWMRMRGQLVAGEPPSPLARVLAAADSGNGVSLLLPVDQFTFINPDLTVVLARPLHGEWVCLDAHTTATDRGIGLADTRLWDSAGLLGRGVQTLLIAARG
jgi:hypothetical protein